MAYHRESSQSAFRPGRRWRPRRATARRVTPTAVGFPYRSRQTLLSRGEAAFFGPLQAAVGGDFLIMCKVRLADVVTCPVRRDRRGPFSAISQKHLDFVLCDASTTRIILAIELDDRSHDAPRRQKRDRFVNDALQAANIPLVRFSAQAWYSILVIRENILRATDPEGILFAPPSRHV